MTPRAYLLRTTVPRIPLARESGALGLYPAALTRIEEKGICLLRLDGITAAQRAGLNECARRLHVEVIDAKAFRHGDDWCEGAVLRAELEAIRRLSREIAPTHASVGSALAGMLAAVERRAPVLRVRGGTLTLDGGSRVVLMGILNVTPDSFSDGGRHADPGGAREHALKMAADGARIIDVGGESTRPGAVPVPPEEEMRRAIPVVEALRAVLPDDDAISIDPMKAEVARAAVAAGAGIINDVSALTADPQMPGTAAALGVPVNLGHMRGTPQTMQVAPRYDCVIPEVIADLTQRATEAIRAGVESEAIILDPGIGFGKRREDNAAILRHLPAFVSLGRPVAIGISRKSFLGALAPDDGPQSDARADGTLAAETLAVMAGVHILRTHDPARARRAALVAEAAGGAASVGAS